jgi:NAD(P)-dependent dehydrogenase (short-subunit alcohol dehydrogenase family)
MRRFRPTDSATFLRGQQITDEAGSVEFQTIVPGWYTPRTLHIHVRVSQGGKSLLGTEPYFPDDFTASVQSKPPYLRRGRGPYVNAHDIELAAAPRGGRRLPSRPHGRARRRPGQQRGAAFPRYAETSDGVERTFALNHLAPFHLTHLMLADGLLSPDARDLTISSDLVTRGRVDATDPDVTGVTWRDRFSQLTVYGSAKLTSLLATTALATRLPAGMSAYSANPGLIKTRFNAKAGGLLRVVSALSGLFAASPDRAANTPVLLATATNPPADNGGYVVKGASAPPTPAARGPRHGAGGGDLRAHGSPPRPGRPAPGGTRTHLR